MHLCRKESPPLLTRTQVTITIRNHNERLKTESNIMFKVLVVCTGNICRSPMAAGLLRHYLPESLQTTIEVASAGTHALHGHQAETNAVEAMNRIGIDITGHRARQITRGIARGSDLILTMETAHNQRIKGLLKWRQPPPLRISEYNQEVPAHDIADPYGGPVEAFEECLRTLRPCIKGVILSLGNQL
jgi:protein-tyrosine phosphatase